MKIKKLIYLIITYYNLLELKNLQLYINYSFVNYKNAN